MAVLFCHRDTKARGEGFRSGDRRRDRPFRRRAVDAHHLPAGHFRTDPKGLALSSLGLGTYIGRPDAPTDLAVEQAVGLCLASGRINVLDTAINYRYQRAERSIGRSLGRAIVRFRVVARDEIFVSTKNGYLAPDGESPRGAPTVDRARAASARTSSDRPTSSTEATR